MKNWLIGKDPDSGEDWRQEEKGTTEDEMDDEHEFEQAPGVGDGQGSLVRCTPWGRKESDMTERLNWTELNWTYEEVKFGALPHLLHFLQRQNTERCWHYGRDL